MSNVFYIHIFTLGSFEESVLNGRLEPVSTVHGFTAELGASGSFVPKHLVVPVTVFFYTLGDNDKVSSPYLVSIQMQQLIVFLSLIKFQNQISINVKYFNTLNRGRKNSVVL